MKAILVIDVDEKEIGKSVNYISINGGGMSYTLGTNAKLKPMPLKRRSYVLWGTDPNELDYKTAKFISTHEISEYDKGWNDCVDFLEGEEE